MLGYYNQVSLTNGIGMGMGEYLLLGVLTGVTPYDGWLIRTCAGGKRVVAFHIPNAVAQ